jgi:hypothetical protein
VTLNCQGLALSRFRRGLFRGICRGRVVATCSHLDDRLDASEAFDGSFVAAEPCLIHAARSGVGGAFCGGDASKVRT